MGKRQLLKGDPRMKPEQFDREMRYQAMLSIARNMLSNGLMTGDEFAQIEQLLDNKYHPVFRAA